MPWLENEPIWELTEPPVDISFKYPVTEVDWFTSLEHQLYKVHIQGIWMGRTWFHTELMTSEMIEDGKMGLIEQHINAQIQSRIQQYAK